MIENLKFILSMMKDKSLTATQERIKECAFSLECAIDILEVYRKENADVCIK